MLTGIETSPKETVAEPIACAVMRTGIIIASGPPDKSVRLGSAAVWKTGDSAEHAGHERSGTWPRRVPRETHSGDDARTIRGRGAAWLVRRAQALRAAPSLRSPPRDGGSAPFLGGAEGTVARPGREAVRGRGGGPSRRLRGLRGGDPRRELRCRADDRVGPRALDPARGPGEGVREGEAPLRAEGLQAARRLDARPDEGEPEGLALHQAPGLQLEERCRSGELSRRVDPLGAVRGRAARCRKACEGGSRGTVEDGGAAPTRERPRRLAHARTGG